MNVKLLTKEIRNKFPGIGETGSKKPEEVKVIAKFFTPDSSWTWYATEFDGKETFFGYVCGQDKELGYFNLNELKSVRGPLGLNVERDRFFSPSVTLKDVMDGKVV
jgi:hypothetical protein